MSSLLSERPPRALNKRRPRALYDRLPPAVNERVLSFAGLFLLLIAWQIFAWAVDLGDSFPPPTQVFPVAWDLVVTGNAFPPLWSTLSRTTTGFALGFLVGITYGILAHVSPRFAEYSRGVVNVIQYSPSLVIIFVGLIIFGSTYTAVVLIIALAMFAEVGVYMRDAFQNFDQDLVTLSKSYKVGLRQRVSQVYVPFLIPHMLAAGRIGFTLAWKVAFLTEAFGYPAGLGWEVRLSYTVYNMPLLLAWLTVFVVVLLLIEQAIRTAERILVKW